MRIGAERRGAGSPAQRLRHLHLLPVDAEAAQLGEEALLEAVPDLPGVAAGREARLSPVMSPRCPRAPVSPRPLTSCSR